MKQYLELLQDIMCSGARKPSRAKVNGVEIGTRAVFGRQLRFDLNAGFPMVTTKRVFWKGIVAELLWMLRGETNVKRLQADGVTIWDEWADPDGNLGPVYGKQWRQWPPLSDSVPPSFPAIDQVHDVVHALRTSPNSRRMVVSAWNVAELPYMGLPPCHLMWQVCVLDGKLQMHCLMRSVDVFLGLPFNIASYALLTHLLAGCTGYPVGDLVMSLVDAHVYENHLDAATVQLNREPRPLPQLELHRHFEFPWEYELSDCVLLGYDPHPGIKVDVAV